MIDLFKNLVINLKATGPAAVLCVWIIAVASVGIWGQGSAASMALSVLSIFGILVLSSLIQNIK